MKKCSIQTELFLKFFEMNDSIIDYTNQPTDKFCT